MRMEVMALLWLINRGRACFLSTWENCANRKASGGKRCAGRSVVVGTSPMSRTASQSEVLERAMQIGQEAERRREAKLVKTAITSAAKGRGGVIQLEETLHAVHQGRG